MRFPRINQLEGTNANSKTNLGKNAAIIDPSIMKQHPKDEKLNSNSFFAWVSN